MLGPLVCAALLLSIERVCYVWIWHIPGAFGRVCARLTLGPIEALRFLFRVFKVVQGAVFLIWFWSFSDGRPWPPDASPPILALGVAAIAGGQSLNVSVFQRLGFVGVFYGNRFGYHVPHCETFPFSVFTHPQYVGALLSIWGLFLVMRFPHADWYQLPAIETVYYGLGAHLEQ